MTDAELIEGVEAIQQTAIERYIRGGGYVGSQRAADKRRTWQLVNRLQLLLARLRRELPEACTRSAGEKRAAKPPACPGQDASDKAAS